MPKFKELLNEVDPTIKENINYGVHHVHMLLQSSENGSNGMIEDQQTNNKGQAIPSFNSAELAQPV